MHDIVIASLIFSTITGLAGLRFFFLKSEADFPMSLLGTCLIVSATFLPGMILLEPTQVVAFIALLLWLASLLLLSVLLITLAARVLLKKEKPITILWGGLGAGSLVAVAFCYYAVIAMGSI